MPSRLSFALPEVSRRGSHAAVRFMCRSLDAWSAAPLCRSLHRTSAPGTRLSLHLGAVGYVTAAGLAELVTLHCRLAAEGGRLTLCEPTPLVAEIFSVTGLDRVLDIQLSPAEYPASVPA